MTNPFQNPAIIAALNQVLLQQLGPDGLRAQLRRRGVAEGDIDEIIASAERALEEES
jgi:hypothetical protein